MAYDGIVNRAICSELKNIIGYKVDKIFEPNKNTVIIGLYKKTVSLNFLACISANNYRMHLTKHEYKNPNVAPNFCMLLRKHLLGFRIKDIYCKALERVTFIEFENTDNPDKPILKKLIIELMGKHSNIILTDSNEIVIDSMRHTSTLDNSLRDVYPTCKYSFPKSDKYNFLELSGGDDFYDKIEGLLSDEIADKIDNEDINLHIDNSTELKLSDFNLSRVISTSFNGISNSFADGLLSNMKNAKLSKNSIFKIYDEILRIVNSDVSNLKFETKLKDDVKKDYYLTFDSSYKSLNDKNTFLLSLYLDDFYYFKEKDEIFKNYRNNLLHLILLTLKKYQKRLENIDIKLEECNSMEKFRLYGELITANLYKISNQNIAEIELENYYNNELIKIPLDKKYSPSYNAKRFFKKYNKLKNALEIVSHQKRETIDDINYIESIVYEIESASTLEELEEIHLEIIESPLFARNNNLKNTNPFQKRNAKKRKNPKKLTTNKDVSFNPLKYKFEGYTILVGRNNKENDYLSLKYASKNDIWFHTKDIHGSHVILKVDPGTLKFPAEDVLYEAARLAALHSKAKNSTNVPVDFCRVSFVKKPRGSKPGMVIYSNNKTIYVR